MAENYDEPILFTLEDEDGVEQTFEQLDSMEVDGEIYYALTPYNPEDQLSDSGELLVLKGSDDEDGEQYLDSIEDDEEYERIGNMFLERLNAMYEYDEEEECDK